MAVSGASESHRM